MVHLGILLTEQHRLLSVAAILDVFETANRFCETDGKETAFTISLLYRDNKPPIYQDYSGYPLKSAPRQDLILIPAFKSEDIAQAIHCNSECLSWLKEQHLQGTEVASFCTGAFLLAASGLLDHKPATTHIQSADAFSNAFPQVQLHASEVTTSYEGIYTSGGATNSFHLMLRLLEKYCGYELAVRTAKYFAIDMNRDQQTYFSTFQPVRVHKDELVSTLQQRIDIEFRNAGTIENMITEIPASRRNLVRRFKSATGLTPIEYLQKTRIEAARKLLERTDQSVMDIMLEAGYNDLKAFRQIFRKYTGMTPTAYREKFYRKKEITLAASEK